MILFIEYIRTNLLYSREFGLRCRWYCQPLCLYL